MNPNVYYCNGNTIATYCAMNYSMAEPMIIGCEVFVKIKALSAVRQVYGKEIKTETEPITIG